MVFSLPSKIWLKKDPWQRVKESRIFVTEPGEKRLNTKSVAYYRASDVDFLLLKIKNYMVEGMRTNGSTESDIKIADEMFIKICKEELR